MPTQFARTGGHRQLFLCPLRTCEQDRLPGAAAGSINYTYDKSGNLQSRVMAPAPRGGGGTIASVNTAGGGADISQNDWIEIKGTGITPATTAPSGVIWSTAPDFTQGKLPHCNSKESSVTVNGKPAFV